MGRRTAWPVAPVRRLWPDRNPLRRAADRAEAAVVALLLVVFLAGTPLVALAAGGWAAASGLRAERAQASWLRVPAVLLQDAPRPVGSVFYPAQVPEAAARWPVPGGRSRTGEVHVRPGARKGSIVMVWTDSHGRLTGSPAPAGAVGRELEAVALAIAALWLALLAAWASARMILNRRRLAAWEADWSATGPQWTGRH
ncbi:MAG: Rv1733c family protein [Streptosporangiaceae bacterium]